MRQDSSSQQFRHIVFPRQSAHRAPVDFSPASEASFHLQEPDFFLPDDESRFLSWLFDRAGIDLRQYRTETLHRRVNACLRTLRANSLIQARQLIEANGQLLKTAMSAMLVGVTSFFRDPQVFEQLRLEILPELAEQRKGIYAWSLGCSEGAELYSLAMLLDESGKLAKSYLLGTDCRLEAIDHAREGIYHASTVAQLSPERRNRYFHSQGNDWQISHTLRKAVRWRVANLLGELEPGLWDLILFRNTAMYLRTESASALWPRLEAALRPGGILVLGRAERPNGAHRLRVVGPCLYRRHRS